jgi:hypothetical protein
LLIRKYLLPQAKLFFGTLAGSPYQRLREAAGWILTKAPMRFVASDLTANVRGCRGMGTKEIGEMLDLLVTGGWLEPENPFPSNRAWEIHPRLRATLVERHGTERDRREEARRLWNLIGRKPDIPDGKGGGPIKCKIREKNDFGIRFTRESGMSGNPNHSAKAVRKPISTSSSAGMYGLPEVGAWYWAKPSVASVQIL